ncbi:ATP-binding cassette domain-containing protein [Jatrophihabitans cynanchi]|jgi:ABC-2 type transport system ATP-binding protein|uniref:ATP-binding cassette domain-containing protein n=1 Tax=Jatrophihabitans cynanchi TaxID=2944128 RepID=A0ABY7JWY9_9ACTN|nr:ATP-binding cassette domain-containing protein [Jatrophihabitans sp. SB3-54]WAX56823.1 ATP-binding cassette domain-containing protein [Jatrophihabitans sp. SB3-54]
MSESSYPALDAADLVKTYPAGKEAPPIRALDGLSVSVAPGSVFALLGPNGAGKSTAVKVLTTLSRADSGRAVVAGHDVATAPDRVRRSIGLVSQKSSSDPLATGRENLVLAGRIQGLTRSAAAARAAELLDRFDLTGAAGRPARTYSGGMARKLDVAIGLVHRPRVLFLDEPTTGLDPQARAQLWAEIARLAGDEQMTVLLTTHYLDEADHLAHRLAIVDAGRIVVQGTPEELKSELRGDTVHVGLAAAADASDMAVTAATAAEALLRAGLREVLAEGATLHGRADSGARAVPSVLAALDAAGLAVDSVTVSRPSLDDVYLRYAGRTFEAAA